MNTVPTSSFRLISAPFTPFGTDRTLNLGLIPRMAAFLKSNGVTGVFVNGTTGEYASLTYEERIVLTEAWIAAGREASLEVIVHVGDNCLANAQKLARHAVEKGADAVSVLAPSYFKPSGLESLVDWCAAVASSVPDCPFYYYHIPGMTGVDASMSAFLKQARDGIPNLAGLKFSAVQPAEILKCLEGAQGDLQVLFGCDEVLLSALPLGVHGAVGSTYNFAAPLYTKMLDLFQQGDHTSCQALQQTSIQMVDRLARDSYLPAAKALMQLFGLDCGPVRLPLKPLSSATEKALLGDIQEILTDCLSVPV